MSVTLHSAVHHPAQLCHLCGSQSPTFHKIRKSSIQILITGFFLIRRKSFYVQFESHIYLTELSSKVSLHIERKHWTGGGSCPKYFCQNCQNLPLPNLKLFLKHFQQVHSYDGTELIPIKRKRISKAGSHSYYYWQGSV